MLKKIITRLLERRHYWRVVGFSELAELYLNRMLRLMAVHMFAGMVGIFMYQLGYRMWQIMLFYAVFFALRGLMTIVSAHFIAKVGPKHATLVSNILYIPGMIALTQLSGSGVWALAVYAVLVSLAIAMYNVSYNVGFSKLKHQQNSGKEIGFMYIGEKVGTAVSPIVGGFIAFLFGPEATMWVASGVFLLSSLPLFLSPEPVMTNQRIMLRGFNYRAVWRQFVAALAAGVDLVVSGGVWSLFAAVFVFGTTSNVVYAQIGGLLTISFIASIIFSRLYGEVIDKDKGKLLLNSSVMANSALHLSRIFAATPLGFVLINIINEAATSGYSIPYTKGMYDMADELPGYRIVYLALMDIWLCTGAVLFALMLAGLTYIINDHTGLQIGFGLAALVVLPIMANRFPALQRRPFYRS